MSKATDVFNEITLEVRAVNQANGWYDKSRTVSDGIALLHSEVSEAFEAYRKGDTANFAEEMADIFIRLIDECDRHDIELFQEYLMKIEKNKARAYRHGNKVV